jgi:hypothetical protein
MCCPAIGRTSINTHTHCQPAPQPILGMKIHDISMAMVVIGWGMHTLHGGSLSLLDQAAVCVSWRSAIISIEPRDPTYVFDRKFQADAHHHARLSSPIHTKAFEGLPYLVTVTPRIMRLTILLRPSPPFLVDDASPPSSRTSGQFIRCTIRCLVGVP